MERVRGRKGRVRGERVAKVRGRKGNVRRDRVGGESVGECQSERWRVREEKG